MKKPRQLTWEDMGKKIEDGVCAGAEDMKIDGVLVNGLDVNQDEDFAADEWVFDELSGRWLDGDKVAEARSEEIGYVNKDLYLFVPATWEECVAETGKPSISTKWVDVDKGTVQNKIIRSRLVARDFCVKGESERSDLFAAMPPLKAKRMLLRIGVRRCREKPCERYKIMLIDVKKSHLTEEVPEDEKVYVFLPSEARRGVARLKRWLYGTRPAAKAGQEHCATRLTKEGGSRRSISAATLFWQPRWEVSLVVHGDDFTVLGPERHWREFERQMRTLYTIKTRGVLGPELHDDKEITVLNRRLVWRDGLITYEADPRIVGNILEAMGLEEGWKTLHTPIVVEDIRREDEELSCDQASKFRSIAALANYLALDGPDLQVAVSVLCQKMAPPTVESWLRLKRVARYLKKYPVLLHEFWNDGEDLELKVFSDSVWASDRDTRQSRSGGVALLTGCAVKSWSNRQPTRAMSSAEAEYYAMVKASAKAFGIQTLAADFGWVVRFCLCVDRSLTSIQT